MSKSEYRIMQVQFEQKYGALLENVVALKKNLLNISNENSNEVDELLTVIFEANWLYEKFGEGEYRDISGLCKVAARSEIAGKGYSLTPGAYVGVAPKPDDGVDFTQRMQQIHWELLTLQAESDELMKTISKNMREMGL